MLPDALRREHLTEEFFPRPPNLESLKGDKSEVNDVTRVTCHHLAASESPYAPGVANKIVVYMCASRRPTAGLGHRRTSPISLECLARL